MKRTTTLFAICTIFLLTTACGDDYVWKEREVTASSYNSVNSQTKKGDPSLAAWGDILKPGMKAIAVSRDLIPLGLKHNTKVRIEGLDGTYRVLDKMNKRWTNKIDIYMGTDVNKARAWGKQKVIIQYAVHKDSIPAVLGD